MKDHLLSIFPLQGMADYARLSCIALDDLLGTCANPFTLTRENLLHLLARSFEVEEARKILEDLDAGQVVQLPITWAQSRDLGFQTKLN